MLRSTFACLLLLAPLAAQEQTPKPAPDAQPATPPMPAAGQPAPAFRLNDHTGKLVTIGGPADRDDAPWTVVAFYPKAATPG
ncbi:MAG: hypothetical protein AB7O97_19500 [Planctomycetota bacterium]